MKPFLKDIAEDIYSKYKSDLKDVVIVFPGKRARLYFNRYLSEITGSPLIAPSFYTISELMEKISGLILADQVSLVLELIKVYFEVYGSKENNDTIYSYCETILSDFDDIDKFLVNASDLYKNLSDLKQLESIFDYLTSEQIKHIRHFWSTFQTKEVSGHQQSFLNLWKIIFDVYSKYKNSLVKKDMAYEGMIYRTVIENKMGTYDFLKHGKRYVFAGFNALNKCEIRFFDYLKKLDIADFYWDYDEYYTNNSLHEAGYFLRENLKNYKSSGFTGSRSNLTAGDKNIKFVSLPSESGQAKAIPEIMDEIGTYTTDSTAIVLGNEELIVPVLHSIPENIKDINISMGYPFKNSVLYNLFDGIFNLLQNKKTVHATISFYYKDVQEIINNSLCKLLFEETVQEINLFINTNNLIFIESEQLQQVDFFKLIFMNVAESASLVNYLHRITSALITLFEKNRHLFVNYYFHDEMLFSLYTHFQRIQSIIEQSEIVFPFDVLVSLLRKTLSVISVPFSGEPLVGIQVLGILETRLLDFENVVLLSMNEGIYPKTGYSPSFIPYNLRVGFALPVPEHKDAIYSYYFYRLIQRAKKVVLVYSSKTEGVTSGERSRFLHQLYYDKQFKIEEISLNYTVNTGKTKKITVEKTRAVLAVLHNYAGENAAFNLSPSALNTYMNCSLRFYFQYIQKIKEPDLIKEEIDAALIGNILHKTMEILYKPFLHKTIQSSDIEAIEKNNGLIEKSLTSAFELEYFKGKNKSAELTGRNSIIKEVIRKYLLQIFEVDKNYSPFEIVMLENKVSIPFSFPGSEQKISVGGFVDRVDKKINTIRIIDYKTGVAKSDFNGMDSLFDSETPSKRNTAVFQIFTYSYILHQLYGYKEIQPALYFMRELFNNDFICNIKDKQKSKDSKAVLYFDEYLEDFKQHLEQLVTSIFNKNIPFVQTHDEKICMYCPYSKICHKD